MHIFNGDGGSFEVNPPLIPGHEFSRGVAKVGSAVTAVKESDRVSGDPNDMCGECYFCKNAMQCVGNIHTQADAAGFLKEGRKWSLLYKAGSIFLLI